MDLQNAEIIALIGAVAGSSIIKSKLNGTSQVFDLSEAVKQFQK